MTDGLYLDEVVEQTGISQRNIKYWCNKYQIPVEKDGRSNLYSSTAINALKLVKLLSNSKLFNHHFIRLQVQRAVGDRMEDLEFRTEYEQVRIEGKELLGRFPQLTGTRELLPALENELTSPPIIQSKTVKKTEKLDDVLL